MSRRNQRGGNNITSFQPRPEPASVLEQNDSNALNLVREKLSFSQAEVAHAQLAYDFMARFLTEKYALGPQDEVTPSGRIDRKDATANETPPVITED